LERGEGHRAAKTGGLVRRDPWQPDSTTGMTA